MCCHRNLKLIAYHLIMKWILPIAMEQRQHFDNEVLQTRNAIESSIENEIPNLINAKNLHQQTPYDVAKENCHVDLCFMIQLY